MKKSILVLSALLTLVVSGICLQSCSSEYDEYTTEEYGYYTEEEIAEIMALAEKYDLNYKFDPNYYGKKYPLAVFEKEIKEFASIKGEYVVFEQTDTKSGTVVFKKKDSYIPRTRATTYEQKGKWTGQNSIDTYEVSVTIEWDHYTNPLSKQVSGSVFVRNGNCIDSKINANYSGMLSITFDGHFSMFGHTGGSPEYKIKDGTLNIESRQGSYKIQ